MTGHILPESTNACPTSLTTDIQPELPETQLGHVIGACSEDDGVPDIGVSIGLGEGSMLWLGELLKRDGADIGFVFHGPDGKRIVAPIWPNCEWQDVADLLRHHVAPILARLTSTTPTLGDMVMVPRAIAEKLAKFATEWDRWQAKGSTSTERMVTFSYGQARIGLDDFRAVHAMIAAAPASPIPSSVNGAGVRERIARAIDPAWWAWFDRHGNFDLSNDKEVHAAKLAAADRVLALSPALDNTAVEGLRPFSDWHEDHGDVLWWKLPIHESPYVGSPLDAGRSMQIEIYIGLEQHEFPMANTGGWPFDASDEASLFWSLLPDPRVVTDAVADLTAETEKAR